MKYLHEIPHQPFLILRIVLMIPFLKETSKKIKIVHDNFFKIMPTEEFLIEELNDHGMN
jgi:hypothetical protein